MGPRTRYLELIAAGKLQPDKAQARTVDRLQRLHDALSSWTPGRRSFFGRREIAPKSLYLWGGVGRGKSLLMDLFFNHAPVSARRRVHFHAFMQETHERIADWRGMTEAARKAHPARVRKEALDDPVPHVARAISQGARLLCFDEFQVSDITDAMLLGRLFECLFEEETVIVTTSNRHPDALYENGINRDLFLPAINLIKARFDIHKLEAAQDYRLGQLSGARSYFSPLGPDATGQMDAAWERLICGGTPQPATHLVKGRELTIPLTARGAARASFQDLCAAALGAEDYLTIARTYQTLFLDDIPLLTPENRNEAKRFVTLIDALYEHRTKFVCSAAAAPAALYPTGHGAFEFQRTVSRLMEMQSDAYIAEEHRSLAEA